MSSEILRQAAALMRERADVAFSEHWRLDPDEPQQWLSGALIIGESSEDDIAAHCASWHPAVALAVADWLEAIAARIESIHVSLPFSARLTLNSLNVTAVDEALAVARTYLGGDQ